VILKKDDASWPGKVSGEENLWAFLFSGDFLLSHSSFLKRRMGTKKIKQKKQRFMDVTSKFFIFLILQNFPWQNQY
jgi:hypothetical protein